MDPGATVPRLESWLHHLDVSERVPVILPPYASVSSPVKRGRNQALPHRVIVRTKKFMYTKHLEHSWHTVYVCVINVMASLASPAFLVSAG